MSAGEKKTTAPESRKEAIEAVLRESGLSDEEISIYLGTDRDTSFSGPVEESLTLPEGVSVADEDAIEKVIEEEFEEALKWVDSLESKERTPELIEAAPEEGFDVILDKLEELRTEVNRLQRGIITVFASQLLQLRKKISSLSGDISDEMVRRLRMKFFKPFIETTYRSIVDDEFERLEREIIDNIVKSTGDKFKEFAISVRESEEKLRSVVMDQKEVVEEYLKSLERELDAERDKNIKNTRIIEDLKRENLELRKQLGLLREKGAIAGETDRRIDELTDELDSLRAQIAKKDVTIAGLRESLEKAKQRIDELTKRNGDLEAQLEIFKTEASSGSADVEKYRIEIESLKSKISILEKALEEKRMQAELAQSKIRKLEDELELARSTTSESTVTVSEDVMKELTELRERIKHVVELEEKVSKLEDERKQYIAKIDELKAQVDEAQQNAMAFQQIVEDLQKAKDEAEYLMGRYKTILDSDNQYKMIILLDSVKAMNLDALAKTLGAPKGLVKSWAMKLQKLGLVEIEGDVVRVVERL